MNQSPWQVGDQWLTSNGSIFVVDAIHADGVAELQMLHPFRLKRTDTQRLLPETWQKLAEADKHILNETEMKQ